MPRKSSVWKEFKNFIKSFKILLRSIASSLGNLFVWAINFIGPVANSLHGIVNEEEYYRIFMTALSAGGGFYGFVQYILGHINEFISDPIIANGAKGFVQHVHDKHLILAVFIVIFISDYFRRKYLHGVKHESVHESPDVRAGK